MSNEQQNNCSAAPLVAIVVPIYNDAQYLACCLDSIKQQMADCWEAWLIDDCSDDDSVSIAKNYCKSDIRFHLLTNEKNSSAWVCRAKGILSVSPTVKYIMFCDADDTLQPSAVKTVCKEMNKKPVDILHFCTNVVNSSDRSRKDISRYSKYLSPNKKYLHGRKVFENFVDRNFEGHLWNKAFNADFLKNIIEKIGSHHFLPKAQDKVLYWAAACRENVTYRSITNKLYNYHYGNGIEGNTDSMTLETSGYFFAQAYSENMTSRISEESGMDMSEIRPVLEESRYNLIRHTVRALLKLPSTDRKKGFDLIRAHWTETFDGARIVCALAELAWNKQIEISDMLLGTELVNISKKSTDIKVIGTYYHRMDNGGIQRVIAKLTPIWHGMGYDVVLFTDCDPTVNDYPLPDYVTRVKIDRDFSSCRSHNYKERGMSLASLIRKYNVDCMVYHSYFSDVLLFDTCICKSMNIPFILYEHNVFSRFLRYNDRKFSSIPKYIKHSNAVVCLDDISANWWKYFNNNVFTVMNPLTFEPKDITISKRDNHNILFLGRLVEEAKRPSHAIDIAARVVKKYHDAKLYMVGSNDDRLYIRSLEKQISSLGIQNNVIMCGFHKNVEQYYEKCSIFLCCSSHEGAPMTLCEAFSYGLPIVMYDLPYLAAVKDNKGVISVRQCDKDSAADAICNLFEDTDMLISTGNSGRAYVEAMNETDIVSQWRTVISSIDNDSTAITSTESIMADVMVEDYLAGSSNKNEDALPMSQKIKRYYAQFGLWQTLLRVFEKIAGQ